MAEKHNLRYFSGKICSMLKEKGTSSYNEIADTLVNDYFDSISETLSEEKQVQTEANIRRRAYDAINVLIAMNIIMKDNREIHWIGLPASSLSECRRLEEERVQTVDRLNHKSEQVKELIIQLVAYKRLIELNRERERVFGKPSEENTLKIPYMILDTPKQAVVDCTSSEDKSEYWLSFSHPFGLYEDVEVLKRLGLSLGLEKNDVSPGNVAFVKSSLPSALRFYINDEDEDGDQEHATLILLFVKSSVDHVVNWILGGMNQPGLESQLVSQLSYRMAHIKWAKMMAEMKVEPKRFIPALLMGKVVERSKIGLQQLPCVHVRVQQNDFYKHTKKYHPILTDFWALDGDVNSQLGDTVLIRPAKEEDKPNERVQHRVDRIVFKHGVLIDPVTKKRVIQHDFVEDLELRQRLLDDIVVEPRNLAEEPSFDRQKEIQQERLKKHKGL
uniref:Uncharacterized protein n=1 Tax=Ditylenchus dipsaci TaxID=166011 RepID=A0A915DQW9_9BILA